jgi:multiple sugar transport system substrate-binding protein
MLFKKILPVLISFTMIATMFAGCGTNKSVTDNTGGTSAQATNQAPIKLTYYGGWTGPDLDRMKGLVDKFNAEQSKIKVEFTSLQWTQMFAKALTDIKAGSPPDIMAAHTFEIGQFADMGVLDSDAIANLKLNKDDYIEKAWTNSSYNGVQYAVPIGLNMHTLFYNKDLFAKQGITAAPTTKEELIAAGQKLTLDKNGKHPNEAGFDANNIVQYGLGFSMNHHVFYQFYSLLNQMDANTFTADMSELKLDEQKAADAFGFLQDEVYKYKMVPKGEKSPIDDFKAGKVAMIIDGCWQISGLESTSLNWDTAAFPKIFDNSKVWGSSEVLTIPLNKNADDAKKAATGEFVKWLSTNSAVWGESGQLPALKSAFETVKTLKGRDALVKDLDNVTFIPAHPLATQIFSSTAPSPILTAAQDTVLNDKDPKAVVKKLMEDMNALLSQK